MTATVSIGDPAPGLRVKDQHGRERSLDEFKGRRVVLWWYPKAETPGCTVEGCNFRDLNEQYAAKGVVLLGASFDSPADNLAFATNQRFTFDLLSDPDRRLAAALGMNTDPASPYAKRWTYVFGPDGRLEQRIEKVDPRSHPQALLASLP